MKIAHRFLVLLAFILSFSSPSVFAIKKHQKIQTIQGANAFPIPGKKHHYIIRVGVNPGPLLQKNDSLKKVMDKMTLITCAEGNCQFMRARTGLGFYENDFYLTKIVNHQIPKVLVVACSYLGCVKKAIENVKTYYKISR